MNPERPEEQLYRLILEDLSAQSRIMRDFQSAVKPVILRLDADVATLKTDMSIMKIDVAELKTDVAELKTDVAELKGSVGRIETLLSGRDNGYS
ncbi:MAG: hypothetical protein OXG60_12025 [Chloroflexi bacterium]|nr:hypothetical protein [Chloroflexota bacterium]